MQELKKEIAFILALHNLYFLNPFSPRCLEAFSGPRAGGSLPCACREADNSAVGEMCITLSLLLRSSRVSDSADKDTAKLRRLSCRVFQVCVGEPVVCIGVKPNCDV